MESVVRLLRWILAVAIAMAVFQIAFAMSERNIQTLSDKRIESLEASLAQQTSRNKQQDQFNDRVLQLLDSLMQENLNARSRTHN